MLRRVPACFGVLAVLTTAPLSAQSSESRSVLDKPRVQATGSSALAAAKPADPAPATDAAAGQAQRIGAPVAKPSLPEWLTIGGQYRTRGEGLFGPGTIDDGFALNRIRLNATVKVTPWAKAYVEVQDARAFNYAGIAPATAHDVFDVREAYGQLGDAKRNPWGVKFGRQDLVIGDQRLVSGLDWFNTARSFDAVRTSWTRGRGTVTALAGMPVAPMSGDLDRWNSSERLYGSFYTHKAKNGGILEPYMFVKHVQSAAFGVPATAIYAYGIRVAGPLPGAFDYNVETTMERGNIKLERLRASAGHYGIGRSFNALAWKPRLGADVDLASGDSDPTDGVRETFEAMYGTAHARFGLVDRVAWRNMQHFGFIVDAQPMKSVKLKATARRLFINELADGLYSSAAGSSAKVVGKTDSRLIGETADVSVTFDLPRKSSLGVGAGYLFAGSYTKTALGLGNMWTPFATYKIAF